jgi:hypothetical protein
MLETQCFINGKYLKLKYRRLFEKGEAFKGVIFSGSAIPFYCHVLHGKLISFEPQSLDDLMKDAIFKAIKNDQHW